MSHSAGRPLWFRLFVLTINVKHSEFQTRTKSKDIVELPEANSKIQSGSWERDIGIDKLQQQNGKIVTKFKNNVKEKQLVGEENGWMTVGNKRMSAAIVEEQLIEHLQKRSVSQEET